MQMCFIFLLVFIFNSFTKEMPGGEWTLWHCCTHDRLLWIWMANFISTVSLFVRLLSDNADIEEDAQ